VAQSSLASRSRLHRHDHHSVLSRRLACNGARDYDRCEGEEQATTQDRPDRVAGDVTVRKFGRGKLLAGALGAAFASLLGRTRPAVAQDDVGPPADPLLLGQENVAEDTTSLLSGAAGPVLELAHRGPAPALVGSSLLPRQPAITFSGAALAGLGPSVGVLGAARPPTITQVFSAGAVGVLGRASLPAQIPITAPNIAGVAGVAPEAGLGVLGSALPSLGPFTQITTYPPHSGSGVAGVGLRSGVEGRTLLPRDTAISIPATLARGVAGISSGLGVLGLSRQTSITLTNETLLRAGTVGLGDEVGVWGSAGVPLPARPVITYVAGVLGSARGPDAAGIIAENPTGPALQVLGAAAFKGGGTGTVSRGESHARVEDPAVRPGSLVNVTLRGDPGNAAGVHYVEAGDGVLDVFLTVPPRHDTPFNYFVYQGC
jgi:hypothetical protein